MAGFAFLCASSSAPIFAQMPATPGANPPPAATASTLADKPCILAGRLNADNQWAPLARGVLTGKYRNGVPSDSRGAAPHFAKHIEPYLDSRSSRIVEAVAVAAGGLGYSPLEVALAWVRDAPGVTSAIIGARTGAQLRGVLKSEEISLPDILRSALNDVSA